MRAAIGDIGALLRRHPALAALVAALALLASALAAVILAPRAAYADIPVITDIWNAITGTVEAAVDDVFDISGHLTYAIGFMATQAIVFVRDTADTTLLTAGFADLYPPALDIMGKVHRTAVIPVANVLATVMMVVGLVKNFADQSTSEAAVDVWRIMLVFVMYGGALVLINASWEIMEALYGLGLRLIKGVAGASDAAAAAYGAFSPEPIEASWGPLFATLVLVTIATVAVILCCIVANVTIFVRAIEIYLYTCYSPIAFAFAVTEGGRQMTEAFLKRYLSLLLAGAIQMVMMMLLGASVPTIGATLTAASDFASLAQWFGEFAASFTFVFVVGYIMLKSGTIARDLLGIT